MGLAQSGSWNLTCLVNPMLVTISIQRPRPSLKNRADLFGRATPSRRA
jgi:hypothetical protein